MKQLKIIGLSLVLSSLLSACSSPPLIEADTGENLAETNKPIYTLVNLHPDVQHHRLYSVNYQQEGLIPRCTPVDIQDFGKKKLVFKSSLDGEEYTLLKHGSSPDFVKYLNHYFGTHCDQDIVASLSMIDQKGITRGEALVGMSKQGVELAIGYPPEHKTPSLKSYKWLYWSNRWETFTVIFDDNDKVESIKENKSAHHGFWY